MWKSIFSSWKTTVMGLLSVADVILPVCGIPPGTLTIISKVAVAVGLMLSKDSNVTGGNTINTADVTGATLPTPPKA